MLPKKLRLASFLVVLAALGLPSVAHAKKKKADPAAEDVKLDEESSKNKGKAEEKPAEEEKAPEETPPEEGKKDEEAPKENAAPADEAASSKSVVEEKDKSYYTVGLRFRGLFIPSFMIHAFGDGGSNVFAPSFGPEFGIRRNGFEYVFAVSYTSYVLTHQPFKAPSDPEEAMELVDAHLKVLYFTADFQWSTDVSPNVAWTYGGGAGLGVVWGPLYRVQAYPSSSAENGWDYCPGPATAASPPIQQQYCQPDPELAASGDPQHWPGYAEPSWADGGSKPLLFPWLAFQTGLRFKPDPKFIARVDVGIGFGQLWFGVGADYGL
jgi:cell division septation protein DedD